MSKVFLNTSEEFIDLSFIKVHPGDWVVLKPNLVKECKESNPLEWESVITSPEIIRRVCEDVCLKLSGNGKVTICDAPQTDSSFEKIAEKLGLYAMAKECSKKYHVPVEILDLRNEEWISEDGVITKRSIIKGDPNGAVAFNLGKDSFFYKHPGEGKYYGADYDTKVVNQHHHEKIQEYLICATPILADVFINLPKLKTHKKTGVTLSLKNLVGINADKNWLPHHTGGSPKNSGDQFPDMKLKYKLESYAVRFARSIALNFPFLGPKIAQKLRKAGTKVFGNEKHQIRSGNWYGNNTTWRMVLDLNRCLLYGNPDGTLRRHSPKRYYSIIDGIIGMEGSGPMQGDSVSSNVVLGGDDPVAVDMIAARVMGFDWRKIPVIREAYNLSDFPLGNSQPEDVEIISDKPQWNGKFVNIQDHRFLTFKPHFGWVGYIEYNKKSGY